MDIVDSATRSRMMSAIRSRDTVSEIVVRKALHAAGLRFRLHRRDLPGSPDIVLPKFRSVVFVHGCFWHRHSGCRYSTTPASNVDFWRQKFAANVQRDRSQQRALRKEGWRVFTVWECETKSPSILNSLAKRVRGSSPKQIQNRRRKVRCD
jgi:DNA mismatch endonuclease (patch repair protein)